MKKIIIVILIFLILLSTNITTVNGYNTPIEVLDQEQPEKNDEYEILSSHIAQSFTPTVDIITKIELYLNRHTNSEDYISIGIRKSLTGKDLTTIRKSTSEIPIGNDYAWIQFDFPDITVEPERMYYIIFYGSEDIENPTYCKWSWYSNIDVYYEGEIWLYDLFNKNWRQSCRFGDLTFKTYGLDEPPEKPTITGQRIGIVGKEYEYKFNTTDPENNNITYYINWGDSSSELLIGPYLSGVEISANYTWLEKGNYLIKVKAVDIYNVESEIATFKINMLKSKTIDATLFLQGFLQRFPFFNKILNQIINLIS